MQKFFYNLFTIKNLSVIIIVRCTKVKENFMKKSTKKKLKKIFNLYNFAVLGCIILIVISLIIIIEPDFGSIFKNNTNISQAKDEVVQTYDENAQNTEENKNEDKKVVESKNSTKEVSEKDARKLAKKQFKELNEKHLNVDDFEVLKIERDGEEYYYISSAENTVEIKISTGEITRINSVKVEK